MVAMCIIVPLLSILLLFPGVSAFLFWIPTQSPHAVIAFHHHHRRRSGRRRIPSSSRGGCVLLKAQPGESSDAPGETKKNTSPFSYATASDDALPANLRRTVRAPRPLLGHVVPKPSRRRRGGGSNPSTLQRQGGDASNISKSKNIGQLRIVAGRARGRALESPAVYLRPMMAKVKEAVFSTLTAIGVYQPSSRRSNAAAAIRHLDLFCGSGSVGLESLSRGATACTFVDLSPECCRCVAANLQRTGLQNHPASDTDESRICCGDALTALRDPAALGIPLLPQYDIVTICPPYEEVVYADLLEAVVGSPLVTDDTLVIIEYPVELWSTLPPVVHASTTTGGTDEGRVAIGLRNRKYGRTVVALYILNPTGRYPNADRRPEEFLLAPSR